MKKKAIHCILQTMMEGEKNKGATKGKTVVETVEEEFCYESDVDDNGIIDVGEWSARKERGSSKVQVVHNVDNESEVDNDDDDDDDDDNDDDDSDDEVGGGSGENDEEKEDSNDNGDEDEKDKRSLNGIQQLMEDEAIASGLSRKKKPVKQGGKVGRKTVDKPANHQPAKRMKKFGTAIRTDKESTAGTKNRTSGRRPVPKKM